jgi:peptidylprolyl isomerase
MKKVLFILVIAAIAAAAGAQTSPSTAKSSSSTPAASTVTSTKPGTAVSSTLTPWIKLPPGVPTVAHGPIEMPFALRYEDIKVGTGAEGAAGKVWLLKYTGWRTADGVQFDSWDAHKQPVIGADGKPELGPDGKPKMGDPQPMAFPQGVGRTIPGFDYGLTGMRIGGKRRLFIPWQMTYGTRSIPDRPDQPGIPAKSDLIFDVELVEVTDMPQPHPGATATAPAAPGQPTTHQDFVPLPADIQCLLEGVNTNMTSDGKGNVHYSVGSVQDLACSVLGGKKKQVPLGSNAITEDGGLATKSFGDIKLTVIDATSAKFQFSIGPGMLQAFREFLQEP